MSTSPGKQLQLTAKTAPPILMLAASRPNSENTWYYNELVVMGKDDLVDAHHGFTNMRMRIMPTNNFGCHALACREGKQKLPPVSVVAFKDYCHWKIKHSTCWDQTEIAKYLPKRFKPELNNLGQTQGQWNSEKITSDETNSDNLETHFSPRSTDAKAEHNK
jgi:hypothetical protein